MGSSTRAGFFRPLRVSPSTPAGLVPSRRHPWGSTLQRFVHFLSRLPFGKPCPSFPWPRSVGHVCPPDSTVSSKLPGIHGFFLARIVAASPWVVAQCLADPCGNTKVWQLRGLLAWPASYRSKDQWDVEGVACAVSANACAPLESRPRFRALEYRDWSPGCARGLGAAFNRLPGLAPLLGFSPFRV